MPKSNIELGRSGERIAVDFLKINGYDIISTNFRNKIGQIDVIAKDNETICFVEVKTRRNQRFGQPTEAIELSKQRKISQVALMYLKENKLLNSPARFDVISIFHPDIQPDVKLIKNAFELDYRYLY